MRGLHKEFEALGKNGVKVRFRESMSRHTSLATGGDAEIFAEVKTLEELKRVLALVRKNKLPLFIIGAGSNLLVSHYGIKGVVGQLKNDFCNVAFLTAKDKNTGTVKADTATVRAGAGTMLPLLVKRCVDLEFTGFESLVGIPGSVGGSLVMNAGTNEGNISDKLISVKIIGLEGGVSVLEKEEISFGYRKSGLEGKIVLEADFLLKKDEKSAILKRITENLLKRSQTQPLSSHSAGSIFKNPQGGFAGKLIEECQLKGYKMGGAQVSEKHANFIINTGNATPSDIQNLIMEVRRRVNEKFGINLELEIKII